MSNQKNATSGSALSLERMLFFSDAVFAIAITLLVIELKVPEIERGSSSQDYLDALGHMWPSFFAFALSFLVIGRFWISHHQMFERAGGYDWRLTWPNLHLLMAIAFMPFATAMLGANLGALVPALLYDGVLLVTGLLGWRLLRKMEALVPMGPAGRNAGGAPAVVAAALVSVALAFVWPPISQMGMATVPLWMKLFGRNVK